MTTDPIAAQATAPGAKSLVLGGIGSGKTTALEAVRNALRANGTTIFARLPRNGDTPGAAIVIDDAHLLTPTELDALTELAGEDAAFMDGSGGMSNQMVLMHRALSIAGGTSEIKRNQIGERILGLPRDPLIK